MVCIVLITSVLASPQLHANTCLQPSSGPSIALVLSGGGARGVAHVGVLRSIEALNIPIHCVVGTSMGSVVGALYAIGHDADSIKHIVETVDWNRGFVDEFPRRRLPLRRKDEEDEFLINFELGVRDRSLNLPRGVIQGHGLHLLLKELFAGASLVNEFDQLPIPFRAVATDIVTAETVSLSAGDLASAVQASMSIPGVFAPVELGGRLLVDGGVTSNLPIATARAMGADVVIAVDIGTPLTRLQDLNSVVSLLDQVTNILTQENVEPEKSTLTEEDVYIQPNLDGYATMDFALASEIAEAGYQASIASTNVLSRLSVATDEYKQYQQQRSSIPALPQRINTITLRQESSFDTELLEQRLAGNGDVESFDQLELHEGLNLLHSTGLYERVTYQFENADDHTGSADIAVIAEQKTWGPDLLRFGFSLEDDFGGNNNFNVSMGYLRKAFNRLGGDVRVIGQIGETPRFLAEYFQPLSALSEYYVLSQFEHKQFSQGVFAGNSQTGEFRTRRNRLGFFFGRQIAHHSDIRFGVDLASGRVTRRVGDLSFAEREDFAEGAFVLQYRYDTLDSNRFPTRGRRLKVRYESANDALGADEEFDAVSLDALGVYRYRQNNLVLSFSFQSATHRDLPAQKQFSQGGLLNTSGLSQDVRVGQHAARLTGVVYRSFESDRIAALEYPVYFGLSAGAGEVFQQREDITVENLQISGSVFVAADTPAGPAFLGLGAAEGEGLSLLLSLGVTF